MREFRKKSFVKHLKSTDLYSINTMNDKDTKTKLCLILPSHLGGGAQKIMLQLANNFNRDKFDISLILFQSQGDYADLIPQDIPVFDLNMRLPAADRLKFAPGSFLRLCHLLRKLEPDIIFSTITGANLYVLLAKIVLGLKSYIIIRETIMLDLRLSSNTWHNKLKRILCKIFYPCANKVVAPADSVLKDLNTFIKLKKERQIVIPNFVNPTFIDRQLSKTTDFKQKNLQTDKPIIISVGRFDYVKGIDIGIKAFKKITEEFPCYYWLLGKGAEKENLMQMVKSLNLSDLVFFLEFQSNPYVFLEKADIFLLPSRYGHEGFPNALLEAMYCRLPCVVSRYNESVESVIKDGFTGIITESENPMAMARAIRKLLENPELRQHMGAKARIKADSFNIFRTVEQYEHLFTDRSS